MFHEYLRYDNGKLYWIKRNGNEAGYVTDEGYRTIVVKGKSYQAHRIVWYIHNGEFPKEQTDHLNGIRDDNRIENLRDVSNWENGRNQRLHKSNTSGQSGIHYHKRDKRWIARIRGFKGERIEKRFKEKNDAVTWRQKMEAVLGYHPNHGQARQGYKQSWRSR